MPAKIRLVGISSQNPQMAVIATHICLLTNFTATTNESIGQLLGGANALWPTQPEFWVDMHERVSSRSTGQTSRLRLALLRTVPSESSWQCCSSLSWISSGSTQYNSRSWLKLRAQHDLGTCTDTFFFVTHTNSSYDQGRIHEFS